MDRENIKWRYFESSEKRQSANGNGNANVNIITAITEFNIAVKMTLLILERKIEGMGQHVEDTGS